MILFHTITDCNYSTQSEQPNIIVHQTMLFGLISDQVSIISKITATMGTPREAFMFVKWKQIRQETDKQRMNINTEGITAWAIMATLVGATTTGHVPNHGHYYPNCDWVWNSYTYQWIWNC